MNRTQSVQLLTANKSSPQLKSLSNFILLNENRQVSSTKHLFRPLQTTERNMYRTNSLNHQISFGGSYTDRKSILVTLNKNGWREESDKQDRNMFTFGGKQIGAKKQNSTLKVENILRTKLSIPSQTHPNPKASKLTTLLKNTFTQPPVNALSIQQQQPRQKMKLNLLTKFTTTTLQFNKKIENTLAEAKANSFRLRQQSRRKSVSQSKRVCDDDDSMNKRIIGIITVKKYGLRVRLEHVVASVCICQKWSHRRFHILQKNRTLTSLIKNKLSLPSQIQKPIYYFRLNKQSISSINELPQEQNVILALISPVWNIEDGDYASLCEEWGRLSKHVKQCEGENPREVRNSSGSQWQKSQSSSMHASIANPPSPSTQSPIFDYQLIHDIPSYIDQIVQNPEIITQQSNPQHTNQSNSHIPSQKQKIMQLCSEKFDENSIIETGQGFRNPLLEDHSHYHRQVKEKQVLGLISERLGVSGFVKNAHMTKTETVDQLIHKAKQEKQLQIRQHTNPNIITRNIRSTLNSKKSLIHQLDSKHPTLFSQNIPYMMNKYGISRYQIHNLFTIYKTLQKISAIRHFPYHKTQKILSKGIDRGTFDEGMRRLDINPGDEVIKTICYFDDFISWEQFIKILSIGLRKTPEEKLQAILTGIGGVSSGQLNKKQIQIMIGNSLMKIFDSDQVELKEYFTEMAMKDLDADNDGTVDINQIKKKCLSVADKNLQNENMDLVAFLLLNS